MTKHGTTSTQELDDKSLTICSGLDMVNINYLHVVCETADQAKVFTSKNIPSVQLLVMRVKLSRSLLITTCCIGYENPRNTYWLFTFLLVTRLALLSLFIVYSPNHFDSD